MNRNLARIAVTTFAVCILLSLAALAQDELRGTWTAEVKEKQSDELQVQLFRQSRQMHMGTGVRLSELKGLSAAALQGSNTPVKFQLARDAGTIQFEGTFNKGLGHGEFLFTANPEYISAMKQMGYSGVDDKAFELATIDVSRAYAKELRDLGYNPDLKELISARIFNVNRDQVQGMKAAGVTDLSLKKLIEYRIFKVTPEYVKEMRASFPNLSFDKLVAMRIHNATPEFAKEMAQLGYSNLDADKLVAFRIHGVTPEFIREMRALGFKDLDADQLVQFRIFGVGTEQINDLAKAGYKDLSADQLVSFRIHKIDSRFIERVKKAGYDHPSPEQLLNFKIMGIRNKEIDL